MKGNYLWPGMYQRTVHCFSYVLTNDANSSMEQVSCFLSPYAYCMLIHMSSAFNVDDSLNQPLADWYGIVMGTR